MVKSLAIYCCGCTSEVAARLTDGQEVYPHRPDLAGLPFWRCDRCGNHVGCHHKTAESTRPLGCIPDKPMKGARVHIHAILDPIWKDGHMTRGQVYKELCAVLGRQYHTAELRTLEEARAVYRAVLAIRRELKVPLDGAGVGFTRRATS